MLNYFLLFGLIAYMIFRFSKPPPSIDDYKKKKVDELKKICKDKGLKGYSKLKKNELIDKLIEHYEHEIREVAEREIEEARLKYLMPVEHKKREKHVRQDLQAINDMAEDVKRMRKERLKRTRQFRGSVMSHQEKVQESVNRAKKKNRTTESCY